MFKIIQKRKFWYILSAIIILPGLVAILSGGLKLGIDFTGGSLIRIAFNDQRPDPQKIKEVVTDLDLGTLKIQPLGYNEYTIRLKDIDNNKYQEIISSLKENFGDVEEKSFESIGPTIGKELRDKAIVAVILVLFFIIIYISFAFKKLSGGQIKSWVYGLGALTALFHDILLVVGIFAILGKYWQIEIDTLFITALLTVLGFSVHDTIVVYDRVRERLKISINKTFEETVNDSVNQTLVRSINTSLTTLVVLLALYLFGGDSIKFFILALIIGIFAGTYSSIYIASPFLVSWQRLINKSR